jgi:membrane protease YdiL (CAAX protease family)
VFLFAFVFVSVFFGVATQMAISALHVDARVGSVLFLVLNGVLSLIPAILIGWMCGSLFEKLPFRAIGAAFTGGWLRHLMLGCVIGAATLSFAVLIAWIFGGLRFEFDSAAGTSAVLSSLGLSFAVFAVASAFEEALFRGYILQTFSRSGLAWLAILLTSVFFGAVHLGNPNAGPISTANTILAGLWFSVAYLKTRDLWFVWGLHLMWNWMQGSFFGIEVSGLTEITTAPLLREIDTGPIWLTGQTYGIEGGIVCSIAIIVSIAAIWFLPILRPDEELLRMTSPPPPGTQAPSPATPVSPA